MLPSNVAFTSDGNQLIQNCFFFFSRHAAFEIDEDSSTLMLGECDKNCDFGTTGEKNNLDRYKARSLVLNGAQSLVSPLN